MNTNKKKKQIIIILIVGIIIDFSAGLFMWKSTREAAAANFIADAETYFFALEKDINVHLEVLKSITSFYHSSKFVDRDEFHSFTKYFLSRHTSIQALEWIPKVPLAERAHFETLAKKDGFDNFSFTDRLKQGEMVSSPERSEYYPVYYVEPLESNRAAIGFDLASNPTRKAALDAAIESGQLIATAKIMLVQETGSQSGFLVFEPIFATKYIPESSTERQQKLKGFALGVFRVGDLVENAISFSVPHDLGINFTIRDITSPEHPELLYIGKSEHESKNDEQLSALSSDDFPFTKTQSIQFGERVWELQFFPTQFYLDNISNSASLITVLLGMIITLIIVKYMFSSITSLSTSETLNRQLLQESQQKEAAQQELKQANEKLNELYSLQTEELLESKNRTELALKSSDAGLWDWNIQTGAVIFNERWAEMLGYTLEEVEPHVSFWEKIVHPDDMPMVMEVLTKHLEGKTDIYQTEHRCKTKTGKWLWILDAGKVVEWDKENKPLRAIGTHIDITDRKQAEGVLKKERDHLKNFYDSALGQEEEIMRLQDIIEDMGGSYE